MNIQKILKNSVFTENEAAIYTALLKHSESTAFHLAKETEIARTTTYHTLEALQAQNYVSSWKKNNVIYYTAESPNQILKLQEEKQRMIKSILPELLQLRGRGSLLPAAKLYMGVKGVKFVWDDILETLERDNIRELRAFSSLDAMNVLPKYFPEWLKRREKLNIFSYLITASEKDLDDPSLKSNQFRETRLLPSDSPFGTLDIYGNKIAFLSFKEKEIYAIIIESPAVANMLRSLFIATWKLLEPQPS